MDKKIDLEKIIAENAGYIGSDYYVSQVKKAMIEFGRQLLELAAENADIDSIATSDDSSGFIHEINKQSILDTIKQV